VGTCDLLFNKEILKITVEETNRYIEQWCFYICHLSHSIFGWFQQNPSTEGSLKPVMVWFHGGGFVGGSGNSEIYGPDYLVAEDVVLVTCNFRLGPFGNYVWFVAYFQILCIQGKGGMYCHHICWDKCLSPLMTWTSWLVFIGSKYWRPTIQLYFQFPTSTVTPS
jgi:hypothetical protein